MSEVRKPTNIDWVVLSVTALMTLGAWAALFVVRVIDKDYWEYPQIILTIFLFIIFTIPLVWAISRVIPS